MSRTLICSRLFPARQIQADVLGVREAHFQAHENILLDKSKSHGHKEEGKMKLYQIKEPGAVPVLMELEMEDGKPRPAVCLGESGRGRKEAIIPVVGEGTEVRAKQTDESVVLVRGDWNDSDGRCLAVINTCGTYSQYRCYTICNPEGVQTIASGNFAFGIAGRAGSGDEILAIVSPGATFRLTSKYASYWYMWDGKTWWVESPEERKARLALAKVEQGGGEWL